MKMLAFYVMLFFISPACASNPADSAVAEKAWIEIDPHVLNSKINQAYQSGLGWVKNPRLYVFELFYFDEIKQFTYDYEVDNTESPQAITISLIRDGFLDDSVRGDLQRIHLGRDKGGAWSILSIKKAYRCWRSEVSEKPTYTTKPCP
jgi:hypothetical protein